MNGRETVKTRAAVDGAETVLLIGLSVVIVHAIVMYKSCTHHSLE